MYRIKVNERFQLRLAELFRGLHGRAPKAYEEIRDAYKENLNSLSVTPHMGTNLRLFDERGALDFEEIHVVRGQRSLHIRIRVNDREKTVELVWAWMDAMDKFKDFKMIW